MSLIIQSQIESRTWSLWYRDPTMPSGRPLIMLPSLVCTKTKNANILLPPPPPPLGDCRYHVVVLESEVWSETQQHRDLSPDACSLFYTDVVLDLWLPLLTPLRAEQKCPPIPGVYLLCRTVLSWTGCVNKGLHWQAPCSLYFSWENQSRLSACINTPLLDLVIPSNWM